MGNENSTFTDIQNMENIDEMHDMGRRALGLNILDPEKKFDYKDFELIDNKFIDNVIEVIKYYNYQEMFKQPFTAINFEDPFSQLGNMISVMTEGEMDETTGEIMIVDNKLEKSLITMLYCKRIVGDDVDFDAHYQFCKKFKSAFGFTPVLMEIRKEFIELIDKFHDDHFHDYFSSIYIFEGTKFNNNTVYIEDYYTVFRNYCTDREAAMAEMIERNKWLSMIDMAQIVVQDVGVETFTVPCFDN